MSESFEVPAESGWRCGNEMKMNFEVIEINEEEVRKNHLGFDAILAIGRVYDLHKAVPGPYDDYICDHCTDLYIGSDDVIPYPCPTIRAIEGEQ